MALTLGQRPRADHNAAESKVVMGVAMGDAFGPDPLAQSFVVTRTRSAGTDKVEAAALDTRDLRHDSVVHFFAQSIQGDAKDSLLERARHAELSLGMIIPRLGKCLGLADESAVLCGDCLRMISVGGLARLYNEVDMPLESVLEYRYREQTLRADYEARVSELSSRVNGANEHALGLLVDMLAAREFLSDSVDRSYDLCKAHNNSSALGEALQKAYQRLQVSTPA